MDRIKSFEKKLETSHADLAETLRNFVDLVDKRFNLIENRVGAVHIGVDRAKDELRQQIEGLGMRIDDLSSHRAKYSDIEILQKQIADIRKRLDVNATSKK